MLFNSFDFIIFAIVAFTLYWLVFNRIWKGKLCNAYLICISYVFYGWVDCKLCILLFAWTLSTYLLGLAIGKSNQNRTFGRAKFYCAVSIVIGIGMLIYFKYTNFFIDCVANVLRTSPNHFDIILPLGISFYTLQMLTYTIELYRGTFGPEKNPVTYFAAMNFFPPLLSGPIGRAKDLLPQFKQIRNFDYDLVTKGFRNILWGLFMKVVIADRFGLYVDAVYSNIPQHSGATFLVAACSYSIQIYCDFWGYSLMAKGVAEMFGFNLIQNFNRPYLASSLREFWSRWHISLSTWFRDYVYIPLGGSRCAKWKSHVNLIVTFLVSGLWHGAALTFCVWGLLHGIMQVIEKMLNLHKMKSNRSLCRTVRVGITFILVTFAWIFFRLPSVGDALTVIEAIFTRPGSLYVDSNTMLLMIFGMSVLLFKDIKDEFFPEKVKLMSNHNVAVRYLSYIAIVVIILTLGVLDGGQFIYFQF